MELDELKRELDKLNISIKDVLKKSGFDRYGDLSEIEYNKADPDARQLAAEFDIILDSLEGIKSSLEYFKRPIVATGTLSKNESGRYCFGNYTYTSGSPIEYLKSEADEEGEHRYWKCARVEHNGKDYYIYGDSKTTLLGLQVRVRE